VRASEPGNASANEGQVPSVPDPQLVSHPEQGAEVAASGTLNTAPQETQGDDPKDKDKSSLSTTVTGTYTRTFRRKANKSPASENAPSSSTHVEKPAEISRSSSGKPKTKVYNSTRSSKLSFFSRLVRKLVPCTSTSRTHPLDIDDKASGTSELDSSIVLKEKQGLKDVEKESGPSHPSKGTIDTTPAPSPTDTSSSLPLATSNPVAIISLPPPVDSDVIIPPSKQLLPESETEGVTSGAVQPPGSTGEENLHDHTMHGHPSGNETDDTGGDEEYQDANNMEDMEDDEDRLIRQGGAGIPIGSDGELQPLLPPIAPQHVGRKCLVLDLDETLVHSSFKSIQQADYIVPVEIDHHWHNFYVLKRPGVDDFLREMGLIYEVVVFTASLSVYADPVLDKLDIHQAVTHRLFRESCYNHKGNYVKDLSQLGRPMTDTIILDNSPASYIFHPNNAVPVSSWFNDPHDTELTDMCPFLADLHATADVRGVLDAGL